MGKEKIISEHERILILEEAVADILGQEQEKISDTPYVVHNYTFPDHLENLKANPGDKWPSKKLSHCNSTKIYENVGDDDDEVKVTLQFNQTTDQKWEVFSAPNGHTGNPPMNATGTDWENDSGVCKGPIKVKKNESLFVHCNNSNTDSQNIRRRVAWDID